MKSKFDICLDSVNRFLPVGMFMLLTLCFSIFAKPLAADDRAADLAVSYSYWIIVSQRAARQCETIDIDENGLRRITLIYDEEIIDAGENPMTWLGLRFSERQLIEYEQGIEEIDRVLSIGDPEAFCDAVSTIRDTHPFLTLSLR